MAQGFGSFVSLKFSNGVALIGLACPPSGLIDAEMRTALLVALAEAAASPKARSVVIAGEEEQSLALDLPYVERLDAPKTPTLADVCEAIATLPKPVVAALRGRVADTGLELALAATARLALSSARLCLPSLAYARLPAPQSLLCLGAKLGPERSALFLSARTDTFAGDPSLAPLIDSAVGGNAVGKAAELARSLADSPPAPKAPALEDPLRYQEEIALLRRAADPRFPPSPELSALTDALEAALLLPPLAALGMMAERDAALATERAVRCQSYMRASKLALMRRKAGDPPEHLGIVGTHRRAIRLATLALRAGLPVTLIEGEENGYAKAAEQIGFSIEKLVQRGAVSPAAAQSQMSLLSGASDLSALAHADVVIEAGASAVEDIGALVREVRSHLAPDALLLVTSAMRNGAGRFAGLLEGGTIGALFHADRGMGECVELALNPADLRDPALRARLIAALGRIGLPAVLQRAQDGLVSTRLYTALCVAAEEATALGADPLLVDQALPVRLKPFASQNTEGFRAQLFRLTSFFEQAGGPLGLGAAMLQAGVDGRETHAIDRAAGRLTETAEEAIVEWRRHLREAGHIGAKGALSREDIVAIMEDALFCSAARLCEDGVIGSPWEADYIAAATLGYDRRHGPPAFAAGARGLLAVNNRLSSRKPLRPDFFAPPARLSDHIKLGRPYARPGELELF